MTTSQNSPLTLNSKLKDSPHEGWQSQADGVLPTGSTLTQAQRTAKYKSLPYNPKLRDNAKALRKAGNLSEVIFWNAVKSGQLLDLDFERQKIIGNYIVDFYCPQLDLVVEIDGCSYDNKGQYDLDRDKYLVSLGLEVVHIEDWRVKKDFERVQDEIYALCKNRKESVRPTVEANNSTPPYRHPSRGEFEAQLKQEYGMVWKKVKLGEVISVGGSKIIDIESDQEYTVAGVQSYGKGVVNRRRQKGISFTMKKYQVIEKGYLMWCKVDTKNGAFGITKDEHIGSLASTNMCLAKIDFDKILPNFLEIIFFNQSFYDYITHFSSGSTNRKYLTPRQLCTEIEITLPPITEQQEFVKKFQATQSKQTELLTQLTTQQSLIKKLKQAYLSEAIRGELLPQTPSDEPASELLARIKADKLKNQTKKVKPLKPITADEIPFDIPESWTWCRLGEIAEITRGKSPQYDPNGVFKMLNQKCIKWFYVDPSHSKSINKEWFEQIKHDNKVIAGDILVNSTGEGTIGRSALADSSVEGYINDSHILKVRSQINQVYICNLINSIYGQNLINSVKGATSTKQTELGVNNLSNFIIPVPPLAEQERIVARLDELMTLCDRLESENLRSQAQTKELLAVVLKESLEG